MVASEERAKEDITKTVMSELGGGGDTPGCKEEE